MQTPPAAAPSTPYHAQQRGGADAYADYYAGMDKSMQQKVALTTAYFPVRGTLADMGCGSGSGSFDLACLHDGLQVIGVDIAPESVAYAQAHYRRDNLQFRQGDIAQPLFPDDSLDGVLNSSVFHHLTSFNGFALTQVRQALSAQTRMLRPGGVLIIRDFVIPRGPAEVLLDLPSRDGPHGAAAAPTQTTATLSSAALFEQFAAAWRSSQNLDGPVPYQKLGSIRPGWCRYRVAHRAAAEFVLRKDYRADWEAELREEYTYFSQAQFEEELQARDLRIVLSVELRNPWIVENRFVGHFFLHDLDERPLPFPPTNYLIVGEKVRRGHGVRFSLHTAPPSPASAPFLHLSSALQLDTGRRIELVERPQPVVDLIPFFRSDGGRRLFVLGKQGFPRPLINAADGTQPLWTQQGERGGAQGSPNLDGAHAAGYLTEPLTAMRTDSLRDGQPNVEDLRTLLRTRAGLPDRWLQRLHPGLRYFTSPGGLNERVTSILFELAFSDGDLGPDGLPRLGDEIENYTRFASAGRVRPLLAPQLLRAAQVGGLLDARLELNTYHLLSLLTQTGLLPGGAGAGPWIGADIVLRTQTLAADRASALYHDAQDVDAVLHPPARAGFQLNIATPVEDPRFLQIQRSLIQEHDAAGRILTCDTLECAMPQATSCNTLSVLPVLRVGDAPGDIFVGLELRDLPAVQSFTGSSRFATNPAWRLPRTIVSLSHAESWLGGQLRLQFGAHPLRTFPLGGKYYPAAGATPEVVYPLAVEIDAHSAAASALSFVPLTMLLQKREAIEDGHLLIAMWRLAHALSLLPS